MANEFKLPELGENIESADIVKVHVKKGDTVEVDQVVLEIETDKANVEVPSEVSGIVKDVKVKDGDTAKVGDVIFTVESNGAPEEETKGKGEKIKDNKGDEKGETSEVKSEISNVKSQSGEAKENDTETSEKSKVKSEKASEEKNETNKYEFKLPELGENIEEAQISKVLVSKGDNVKKDQVLLELETDKATVEVPSEVSGKVTSVKVKDGETVKVGSVVIVLETSDAPKEKDQPAEPKKEEPKEDKPKISDKAREQLSRTFKEAQPEEKLTDDKPSLRRSEIMKKVAPASPSVRRFAREIGIDIHNVKGSGPGGRISIEDVKAHAKNLNEKISKGGIAGIGLSTEPLPDFTKWGEVETEQMTSIRRKTAEHLSYAWATIPHVTQFDKADITELEKLRKVYSKSVEKDGGKLTVTAILLKICASAMKVFPQFNSSIDMEKKQIIYKKYVNIGIAVDTDRGLLVPVIRDVDKKNIKELAVELTEISEKARDKKLTIEEMQGGNFSISNLGGIGGTYFTPIVNSPEVAILGVSRGNFEQVYIDGKFEPRMMLPLSLSYDHRIIDGADAARFIRWIAKALENPFLLSLEG